jgi:adenosylcobinamide kinase / adenosylcobinamide-phosphate guanylyltransferase
MGEMTLILGGARSGKSRFAETLAAQSPGRVIYLATLEPQDDEMRRRVDTHRAARPPSWVTLEEPLDLIGALARQGAFDVCLLDCLTLWISNLLVREGQTQGPEVTAPRPSAVLRGPEDERFEQPADAAVTRAILAGVRELIDWQNGASSSLIVVSNEVGSGIVPEYPLGRLYRDVLGEANQVVAAAANHAYLCVAGYAIDLKAMGRPIRN